MIKGLRENRVFPEKKGYVFAHHLAACGMCARGGRTFFRNNGVTKEELADFYKNGMLISVFKERFKHDTMAMQVLEHVENGQQ